MNRDGNRALRTLMQEVYIGEAEARAVLIKIDYPVGSIPKFGTADTFWPPVLSILDAKVESVMETPFPVVQASDDVERLYAELAGGAAALVAAQDERPVSIITKADLLEFVAHRQRRR